LPVCDDLQYSSHFTNNLSGPWPFYPMLQSFFSNTMSWLEDPYSPSLWNKVDSISHLRCKRLIDIRKTNINALFVRTRSLFLVTGGKYWMKQAPGNLTMTSTDKVRSSYKKAPHTTTDTK